MRMLQSLCLGLTLLGSAQAADWDVMDLLKNLQRQGKIADVLITSQQTVNQKTVLVYTLKMGQGNQQNTFQLTGKTRAGSQVFQAFELQVDNFVRVQKAASYATQAGYLRGVLMALSQVCFNRSEAQSSQINGHTEKLLLQHRRTGEGIQNSKTFGNTRSTIKMGPERMVFALEQVTAPSSSYCSLH